VKREKDKLNIYNSDTQNELLKSVNVVVKMWEIIESAKRYVPTKKDLS